PFAGLVLGEQVHAVRGLRGLERKLGLHLHGVDSVVGLLERWDDNLPALRAIARELSAEGPSTGTPLAQLHTHAPLVPRQIFQAVRTITSTWSISLWTVRWHAIPPRIGTRFVRTRRR